MGSVWHNSDFKVYGIEVCYMGVTKLCVTTKRLMLNSLDGASRCSGMTRSAH